MKNEKKSKVKLLTGLALGAVLTVGGIAATDPYLKADDTWISISGTAVAPTADSFTLDYGEGVITVEMDDWDWYGDTPAGIDGDAVTVYGKIDDDMFEARTIEASSVYVEDRGTYYYANPTDEEGVGEANYWVVSAPIVVGETVARGTVASVDEPARELTINTGLRELTVDTSEMRYNPLDDVGYQQIEPGDYVSVRGNMDTDFWGNRELEADSVITLAGN